MNVSSVLDDPALLLMRDDWDKTLIPKDCKRISAGNLVSGDIRIYENPAKPNSREWVVTKTTWNAKDYRVEVVWYIKRYGLCAATYHPQAPIDIIDPLKIKKDLIKFEATCTDDNLGDAYHTLNLLVEDYEYRAGKFYGSATNLVINKLMGSNLFTKLEVEQ